MRPNDTSRVEVLRFGSDLDLRRRFMVIDQDVPGNLRFGLTLEVLDKLAEETALAYVRQFSPEARVVTAAIDSIRVRNPADVTRDLRFLARLNFVGRTSLEVGIRVEQDGDPSVHIASCYFTMVSRLGDRSLPVPALQYVDELERRRERRAIERREKIRRQEQEALEPPSREEFDMLARLHREQEQPGFEGLLAGSLIADSWERVYPEQENVPRKIFGGYLIHRAFQLASIHAEKIASHRAVVTAVNRINFVRPVRIGDTLHFTSRIVYAGRTSLAVETRIERIGWEKNATDLSNNCVFTFVNVDSDLKPQPVMPVYPTTYDEDARYLAGHRRNVTRVRRSAESQDPRRRVSVTLNEA